MWKEDELKLLESPFSCNRKDFPNGRWYHQVLKKMPENEHDWIWFPSTTNLIERVLDKGIGFKMWLAGQPNMDSANNICGDAARRGEIIHYLCMQMVLGRRVDLKDRHYDAELDEHIDVSGNDYSKRMMCFNRFWEEYKPIPLATEMMLFNPTINDEQKFETPWAGQMDLVCLIENKDGKQERWLIDWKTGKGLYDDFELQLTSYKILWDSLCPEQPIHRIGVSHLKDTRIKEPSYKIHEYRFSPKAWYAVVDVWNWRFGKNGDMAQPIFPKEYPLIFDLYEDIEEDPDE